MEEEGVVKFYADMGVNMETDIVCLLVSQYMQAETMGEYKKVEFLKGCESLACDDIATFKAVLPRLRQELKNEIKFKEMYKFVFGFACDRGFKNVEVESSCALWDLLIGSQRCKFLAKWCEFLNAKVEKKELTVVTKDTWDLFYDLVTQTKGDMQNFEDDGCWPVLIDQFHEYVN